MVQGLFVHYGDCGDLLAVPEYGASAVVLDDVPFGMVCIQTGQEISWPVFDEEGTPPAGYTEEMARLLNMALDVLVASPTLTSLELRLGPDVDAARLGSLVPPRTLPHAIRLMVSFEGGVAVLNTLTMPPGGDLMLYRVPASELLLLSPALLHNLDGLAIEACEGEPAEVSGAYRALVAHGQKHRYWLVAVRQTRNPAQTVEALLAMAVLAPMLPRILVAHLVVDSV